MVSSEDVDRHFQPLFEHCRFGGGAGGASTTVHPYDYFLKARATPLHIAEHAYGTETHMALLLPLSPAPTAASIARPQVEQMERWYLPFVRALGLETTVAHGWGPTTHWWKGGRECFYAPPNVSCAVFHATVPAAAATTATHMAAAAAPVQDSISEEGAAGAGSTHQAAPWMPASFHATGTDGLLGQFYTAETADAVNRYAERDLSEFGYPRWEGTDAPAYIRRLQSMSEKRNPALSSPPPLIRDVEENI